MPRGCGFFLVPVGTVPVLLGSAVLLDDGGARIANDGVFVLVAAVALAAGTATAVVLLTLLFVLVDADRTDRLVRVIKAVAARRRGRQNPPRRH